MASIFKVRHNWRAQVRLAGQPSRSQVFATKAEAIRWARAEEAKQPSDLSKGGQAYTVAMAFDAYTSTLASAGKTKRQNLVRLKEIFGHYRLAELKSKHVIDFAKARLSGTLHFYAQKNLPTRKAKKRPSVAVEPSTVLMNLSYLSVVLKYARKILGSEDAAKAHAQVVAAIETLRHTRTLRGSDTRTRRPTEQELLRLEEYFDHRPRSRIPMSDLMHFAICTGMRQGEIVALRWEDFDPQKRTIWVRGRKDPTTLKGRDDLVPLVSGHVAINRVPYCPIEIMHRQVTAKRKTGRIFPFTGKAISKAFSEATDKLHILDLVFHDLRHDAISRLFDAGYQIPQVALISGHRSWKNLQRYTNLAPESLHNYLTITNT